MQIAENLKDIQQKIKKAALDAGRKGDSVKLIAVSKTKPMELIHAAYAEGQLDFGENRVQELREKHPELPEARWHMIGTLQRNKVKYIAPFIHLIHSVDSRRLLEEIEKQAAKNERTISCLLQLNISDEDAKSGMDEAEAKGILEDIDQFPHIHIKGLMGMAAFVSDEGTIRNQFRRLRMAADTFGNLTHNRIDMEELSMGMSGDFEIAIEEGATMVRVGSAVFGSRYYP
ncbi:MAG: YggS family pyridoxal phosphate-dependent enzyme [Bacteroidia bacterium]|nr:YggS family pyridoxal phosphate-dependent enzyme [Bacteroidia bacterium]